MARKKTPEESLKNLLKDVNTEEISSHLDNMTEWTESWRMEAYRLLEAIAAKKQCKTCKYFTYEDITYGHVCTNNKSTHLADFVEEDCRCKAWESLRG